MESNIILPKSDFNYNNITILSPSNIQGKTFLSKIQNNNSDLYIQTPKCISKGGFITSGKRTYIDLLFEQDNDAFIEWFENLEIKIQDEIYKKREKWFRGENIDRNDIEDIFTSPFKTYKSGKYYLIRVYLGSPRVIQHSPLNIFDENENPVDINDIDSTTKMITILQLHGLKFNVNINFQIYIELKQILVIDEEKAFQKPLFKINTQPSSVVSNVLENDNPVNEIKETMNSNIVDDAKINDTSEININGEEVINDEKENVDEQENLHEEENLDKKENKDALEEIINKEKIEMSHENQSEDNKELTENNNSENINSIIENNLVEFNPDISEDMDSFTIKKPNDVYMELYKDAKEKAKKARMDAIKAYMELKHIKQNYQIENFDSDDEFSESEFQSSDEEDEEEEKEEKPKLDFIELS